MRQVLILLGAIVLLSTSAAAQRPAGAQILANTQWQLSLGYQYNRINLLGTPFNTNGLSTTLTRFFGNVFGVEVQAGAGFGKTGSTAVPPNLTANSLFVGGGPRLALRGHGRIEPWIHGVVGMEHFHFTQTAGVLGSNTALAGAGGGGVDLLFHDSRVAFRLEVDGLGSRFFSTTQRHFQVIAGLVYNF